MVKRALRTMGELPLLSSFVIRSGCVDEVTWTSEEDLIRYCKQDRKGWEYVLNFRVRLRLAARLGMLLYRRHPEHGYWEYGPQWRRKDFFALLDAAESAQRLGSGDIR